MTEAVTDRRMTTRHVLDQETDLQRWAQANISRHPIDHTDPHGDATRAMAAGRRLVLVVGPAGTGKTTTTARAVDSLRSQGRPVVALAPSGKAADVLGREAGCPAETLAAFLTRHGRDPYGPSRWPKGTTVVVDEAGMASTDDLHHLVTLTERHGWRVIAIGDPAQLPAVGRGGMFAHWTDTLPAHHLNQPRRFTEPWEAAASLALRAGDPAAATAYDAHDRLSPVHPAFTAARAANLHRQHASEGRTVAITTTSTDTARHINIEIQRQRRVPDNGHEVPLADGTRVGVGDRIATRLNQADLRTDTGRPVRNRHTWTVAATRPDGTLTVTDHDRGAVTLPAAYVARHVELGWAVTGYGTQGDTVDVGIAVLEPGTTRNHTYVALTRGRHLNLAVLPDPTGTIPAVDLLTAMIEPPPRHRSALATARQLRGTPTRPLPTVPSTAPAIEPVERDKVAAMQARLDRLQRRTPARGLER